MAKKKKGIFTRLVEGPERSEDYARKTMPSNRWSLGWSLFGDNLGKIVKINLLMLLFIFPVLLVFYFRNVLIEVQAQNAPFSQNLGFGYPAIHPGFIVGAAEKIVFRSDLISVIIMLVLTLYVSVGISGGLYVMRNLVWTEGVFVASDFWAGVKKNYKTVLPTTVLFVFLFGLSILTIDLCNIQTAIDSNLAWLFTIVKIINYVLIAVYIIIYLYMLSIGVTYKHGFIGKLRNALILTIALIPVNAFFVAFAFIGFYMLLAQKSSILFTIGLVMVIFLAFSVFALIWTNYTQWVFDEFVNDTVKGAKKYRGMSKQTASETTEFVYKKNAVSTRKVKPITDYDVEIATLPESYSRADLLRLQESKDKMIEDSARYEEEHKDEISDDKTAIDEIMSDVEPEIVTEVKKPRTNSGYKHYKKGKK